MRRQRQPRRIALNHGDDWLITYADSITLLLCLFVVLLASQSHKVTIAQPTMPVTAVQQPAAPLIAPGLITPNWRPPLVSITQPIDVQDDANVAVPEDRATNPPDDDLLLQAFSPAETAPRPPPADSVPQPLALPAALQQQTTEVPPIPRIDIPRIDVLAKTKPTGNANADQTGDRITTIVFDSTALFGRASATLNSSGKLILQDVVEKLKSDKYRDYMVTIEGHTDDAPINTVQFPSNWELSTARAAAVVRFYVEQGVSDQRLRAAGYADTRPLQPNRDPDGIAMPENQAKNRRVVIELEKVEHR